MFSIAVQRRMFFVSDLKRATVWRNRLRCARLNYLETKAAALEKCENKLLKCHANSCVNICLGIHYSPPQQLFQFAFISAFVLLSAGCSHNRMKGSFTRSQPLPSPLFLTNWCRRESTGNEKKSTKKSGTTCLFMQLCVRECVCAPAYVATPSPVPSPPTSAWLWTRVRLCVSVRVCFLRV